MMKLAGLIERMAGRRRRRGRAATRLAAPVALAVALASAGMLVAGQAPAFASNVTGASVALGNNHAAATTTYTVNLTTSSTGPLVPDSTITLVAAAGTQFPNNVLTDYSVSGATPSSTTTPTSAAATNSGGSTTDNSVTLTLGDVVVPPSTALTVVADNVVNPTAAGSDTLAVSTSADTTAATAPYTIVADPVSASTSTVVASPTNVVTDQTSTVTVTALDQYGNPVAGDFITLAPSSNTSTMSYTNPQTGSNGQVVFTVSDTTSEAVTYTASDASQGVTFDQTATVSFGGVAASATAVASPASVPQGGTSTVTVTVENQFSEPVAGVGVSLSPSAGSSSTVTPSGSEQTAGNGTASFTVTDKVAETVTYTASVARISSSPTATVTYTPVVKTLSLTGPSSSVAAGSPVVLTATANDTNGQPIDGASVSLSADPQDATGSGTPSTATTGSNGTATFTVSETKAETVTYDATASAAGGGTASANATVSYVAGPVSAGESTVTANPTQTAAGGSGSTITVTVLDQYANPINGATVALTAGSGSSTITPSTATTGGNGEATFTVTDKTAESVTYTATASVGSTTTTIAQSATVDFVPGSVASTSTVVAAAPSVLTSAAGGPGSTTVTVTLLDANDNPVPNKTVVLIPSSSSSTASTSDFKSNAEGQVIFTVVDSAPETVTYTAKDVTDTITLSHTAQVTYVGAPVGANTTFSATPSTQTAGGSSSVTVTLEDTNSQVVPDQVTSLSCGGGSSTSPTSATSGSKGTVTFSVTDTKAEALACTLVDSSTAPSSTTITSPTVLVTFVAGPAVAANSSISPPSTTGVAAGSPVTLTVTLEDQYGNPVEGDTVTLAPSTSTSSVTTSSYVSNAEGQVSFQVSDTQVGTVEYTATDQSVGLSLGSASVSYAAGPVSASRSVVFAGQSDVPAGSGTNVVVELFDAYGNPVPVGSQVVSLSPAAQSGPTVSGNTAIFAVSSASAGAVTYTASVGNTTLDQTATVDYYGAVSKSSSSVVADPTAVPYQGGSSTITVTLKDSNGDPVPGVAVALLQGKGASTISATSPVSNQAGQVIFTVTSATGETVPYSADAGGVLISQSASVDFYGPASAKNSTVSAPPSGTSSTCSGTCPVVVQLFDANGDYVPGDTVSLAQSQGNATLASAGVPTHAMISAPSGPSDAEGLVTFAVSDLLPETVTFAATVTSGPGAPILISETVTITFAGAGPSTLTTATTSYGCTSEYPGASTGSQQPPPGTTAVDIPWKVPGQGGDITIYLGGSPLTGGQAGAVGGGGAVGATGSASGGSVSGYGDGNNDPAPLGGANGSVSGSTSGITICVGIGGSTSQITL